MNKEINILFIIGFLCAGLISCTEIYEPKVENGENILFIEGGISNKPGPYKISLEYAQDYGSTEETTKVSGAVVLLFEDNQLLGQFYETTPGVYETLANEVLGIPGKSYRIVITAIDGNVYESIEQIMPTSLKQLDAVYGNAEIQKIKYYNVYGEFIIKEQEVVQLYADIPVTEQNSYSRFECRTILEFFTDIVVNPGTSSAYNIPLYMWESYNSEDLNILEINSSLTSIGKFPVSHLINDLENYDNLKDKHSDDIQLVYDKVPTGVVQDTILTDTGFVIVDSIIYGLDVEPYDNTFYTGWILHVSQYSITKDAYLFWSDIKKLEESDGELFDPITTQLRGNMSCSTDPNKIIIGLFEVASVTITPAFINFYPTEGNYISTKLEKLDNISDNGWNDTIPPDFWVDKLFVF